MAATETIGPPWPEDRGGHVWPKDREVRAGDGAWIRYTVIGAEDAPWLVLCAGFMCPDNFWGYLIPPLLDRYRVAVLNYRGVGASSYPRDPGFAGRDVRAEDYTIEKHAGDVAAVMDAEEVTGATVIGHSMGCQVALEVWRQRPDQVAALALITGPYASPLHTFYGSKLGVYLFPFAYHAIRFIPRPLQKLIPRAVRLPIAMPGARLIRALGEHTPAEGMSLYFEHFSRGDPVVMLEIAKGMHRFDAYPWLGDVAVPVLVVVGDEDTFTPPEIGDEFLSHLPDAELLVLPGGTHGALIEFPDEIREALLDFTARRLGHRGSAQ
ncbi:MAG: alpha/beta hydrolase [Actinobacteria bacterium]|nr:alpha/beta hydrolase [Actinomycetota bacterium]